MDVAGREQGQLTFFGCEAYGWLGVASRDGHDAKYSKLISDNGIE